MNDAVEEFAVAPLGKSARVFLAFFTVVLPLMIMVGMAAFPEFRPPPVGFALAGLVIVSVAGLLLAASTRRSIRIDDEVLEIKATLYSRRLALSSIDVDATRIVDLREHPENRPLLKTNGYAVPGLAAGNFRDRKRNKLFCLVTAPRVLRMPLNDGSLVLASPARPERLLDAIRKRTGSGSQGPGLPRTNERLR